MSPVGLISLLWGILIIASRGPLVLAPTPTLRLFRSIVATSSGTRKLGAGLVLLALLTVWAGLSEESTLATVLLCLGIGAAAICLLALVCFPQVYMALVEAVVPPESDTESFGWRLVGLIGLVVGVGFFAAGVNAL